MTVTTSSLPTRGPQHTNPRGSTDIWNFQLRPGIDHRTFRAALGQNVTLLDEIPVDANGLTRGGIVQLAGTGLTEEHRVALYLAKFGHWKGKVRTAP